MNNNTIVVILVGVILFSGCISDTSTPEGALDAQMNYLKYSQGNDLYELLSSDLKLKNTADKIQNRMVALQDSMVVEDYKVIDKTENDNTATFKVEVIWILSGQYQKTKTHTVSFILENGAWKISNNPTLR